MKRQDIEKVGRRTQKAQQPGLFRIGASSFIDSVGNPEFLKNLLKLYSLHCCRTQGILDFRKIKFKKVKITRDILLYTYIITVYSVYLAE